MSVHQNASQQPTPVARLATSAKDYEHYITLSDNVNRSFFAIARPRGLDYDVKHGGVEHGRHQQV